MARREARPRKLSPMPLGQLDTMLSYTLLVAKVWQDFQYDRIVRAHTAIVGRYEPLHPRGDAGVCEVDLRFGVGRAEGADEDVNVAQGCSEVGHGGWVRRHDDSPDARVGGDGMGCRPDEDGNVGLGRGGEEGVQDSGADTRVGADERYLGLVHAGGHRCEGKGTMRAERLCICAYISVNSVRSAICRCSQDQGCRW